MSPRYARSQCLSHNSTHDSGHTMQHHRHLPIQHTPLSWVDWKKDFTNNEAAQRRQVLLHLTQSITPAVTSLPPSLRQWKAPDPTFGSCIVARVQPGVEYQTGASPEKRIELIVTAGVGPVWSGQHLEYNAQRQKPLRALLPTSLPPSKEIFFSVPLVLLELF